MSLWMALQWVTLKQQIDMNWNLVTYIELDAVTIASLV
jgi:hypothetical protein